MTYFIIFMSLSRKIVCDAIENLPHPTTRGEEGKLYRISLEGNQSYFAKQWYDTNRGRATPYRDPYSGFSLHSPYWHDAQKNQQDLVHVAFPENTLEMPLAFDNRIKEESGELPEFSTLNKGYPHTVTVEIKGDPELVQIRNQIMSAAYAVMLDLQDKVRKTKERPTQEEALSFQKAVREADEKMEIIFGKELRVLGRLDQEIQRLDSIGANTVIKKILSFGIEPIHPQFNFIPTGKPAENGLETDGVFLETQIVDFARYERAMQTRVSDEEMPEIREKIRQTRLYLQLDGLFNILTTINIRGRRRTNSRTEQLLFHLLELVKKKELMSPGSMKENLNGWMQERLTLFFEKNIDESLKQDGLLDAIKVAESD